MNKITFIVIFVFLACFCFAKDLRESLEFGIAVPYFIENNVDASGVDVKTEMSTVAVNFSGITFFNDRIGLGVYMDVIFPQKMTVSARGQSASVERSAYDVLMAMDMLIGPAFMVYKKGRFSLPVVVGFHYLQLWALADFWTPLARQAESGDGDYVESKDFEFGLGTNITGEYHITNNFYLLARLQLTLDLFSINMNGTNIRYNEVKSNGFIPLTTWGLNATLGIGKILR
ncbi:MAG: hypothetical protein LBK25_00950 [Treponema sp.]|jgi:hypothetical protein|nr:hypothetical protein [Treponema sp.]